MKRSLIILFCLYIQTVHIKVFKMFQPGAKYSKKQLAWMKYYDFLFNIYPTFRTVIKRHKPILKRAHRMYRLSLLNQIANNILRFRAVEHYS